MQVVALIGFLILGLVQFIAAMAGFGALMGSTPWIIQAVLALFVAYIPILGGICGMYGAISVWGWSWWQAILLFFGVPLLGFAGAMLVVALEGLTSRRA